MERYEVWVDFNSAEDGVVTTLRRFASVTPVTGSVMTVGDREGNLCKATVVAVDGELIQLALHDGTFHAYEAMGLATA